VVEVVVVVEVVDKEKVKVGRVGERSRERRTEASMVVAGCRVVDGRRTSVTGTPGSA
jgi:hypothetical protein